MVVINAEVRTGWDYETCIFKKAFRQLVMLFDSCESTWPGGWVSPHFFVVSPVFSPLVFGERMITKIWQVYFWSRCGWFNPPSKADEWRPFPSMTMLKTTGLGGGFKHFLFSSLLGEDEPDLTNIFQTGWNHQLEDHGFLTHTTESHQDFPTLFVCFGPCTNLVAS